LGECGLQLREFTPGLVDEWRGSARRAASGPPAPAFGGEELLLNGSITIFLVEVASSSITMSSQSFRGYYRSQHLLRLLIPHSVGLSISKYYN